MAVIVLQNLTGAQNMPRKAGKALDLDHRLLMPSVQKREKQAPAGRHFCILRALFFLDGGTVSF
jgi:hypothetical protein